MRSGSESSGSANTACEKASWWTRSRPTTDLGRALLLKLSTHRRIGDAMDRLPTARRFVRRFVAGPALEDALAVAERLNAAGIDAAITHLGENVATTADAERAAGAYLEVLDEIGRKHLRAVPSDRKSV